MRRADLALIEAEIAKTEIRAPFDGVAGLRYVSEGAFVAPATRIATLKRADTLKLEFAVPERYAWSPDWQRGHVHASTGASGSAARCTPTSRASSRDAHPVVSRDSAEPGWRAPARRVREGGAALAKSGALLVPGEALVPHPGAASVFVVEGRQGGATRARPAPEPTCYVQNLSGLYPPATLVTLRRPSNKGVKPGATVKRSKTTSIMTLA